MALLIRKQKKIFPNITERTILNKTINIPSPAPPSAASARFRPPSPRKPLSRRATRSDTRAEHPPCRMARARASPARPATMAASRSGSGHSHRTSRPRPRPRVPPSHPAAPAAPRKRWSKPTCASSSRSPRNTPIAACNSLILFRKATSA